MRWYLVLQKEMFKCKRHKADIAPAPGVSRSIQIARTDHRCFYPQELCRQFGQIEAVAGGCMTVRVDPENNEPNALFALADFNGRRVLEIGCGDGRLTWRYAEKAVHVTAIDAFEGSIARAKANAPDDLKDRVDFRHSAFNDFAAASGSSTFDIAILSWSL
jgi:2-polyprenyl-3-methyl-5-hydroxy-6-metoxy-1,4-benzoquinol methylase